MFFFNFFLHGDAIKICNPVLLSVQIACLVYWVNFEMLCDSQYPGLQIKGFRVLKYIYFSWIVKQVLTTPINQYCVNQL